MSDHGGAIAPHYPKEQGLNNRIQPITPARTRGAFTLIELLVVVAIVAMLIALLATALRGTRESARMVKCQKNLTSIATVLILYVDDYKDFPLPNELEKALDVPHAVYRCPGDRTPPSWSSYEFIAPRSYLDYRAPGPPYPPISSRQAVIVNFQRNDTLGIFEETLPHNHAKRRFKIDFGLRLTTQTFTVLPPNPFEP